MLAHIGWVAYGPGVEQRDYHTGQVDCTCGACVMDRLQGIPTDGDLARRRAYERMLAERDRWNRRRGGGN